MATEAWARFEDSLAMDYERWHDGVPIDLDALAALEGDERVQAEARLIGAPAPGWREVQALAVLDTPGARATLRQVLDRGDREVQMAVVRAAPGLLDPSELDALLVAGLGDAVIGGGLTAVLDLVEAHQPQVVLDALVARARDRHGDAAVHLAALADHLLGPATEAFDWDHRPLYLRFHAPPGTEEREEAWRELCARFGAASPDPG